MPAFAHITGVSVLVTSFSSLLLYTAIACERLIAIQLPLWHRINVRHKHIWTAVVIILCFSIGFSLLFWLLLVVIPLLYSSVIVALINIQMILRTIFIVTIAILFFGTFIKALQSIKYHNQHIFETTAVYTRNVFVMFAAFAIIFIPLTVFLHVIVPNFVAMDILTTMLMLTSIINATLRCIHTEGGKRRAEIPLRHFLAIFI